MAATRRNVAVHVSVHVSVHVAVTAVEITLEPRRRRSSSSRQSRPGRAARNRPSATLHFAAITKSSDATAARSASRSAHTGSAARSCLSSSLSAAAYA